MSKSYSPAWRLFTVILFRPLVHLLVRNKWAGQENIPRKGPVIIAPNHMSYADWGTDAVFFYESGRYPTFMIKASAFKVRFIGKMLYGCGQIPVNRGAADAAVALKQAEQALAEGAAVIIYPEGTATRDPGLWPMAAKTGVARLALATGAPVIPVARWGTQNILPYGSKKAKLWPRQTVRTVAGKPVDLSEWAGKHTSAKALRAATDAIMSEVTALVASLRNEEPPAIVFDPAKSSPSIPAGTVAGSTAQASDTPGDAGDAGDAGGLGAAGDSGGAEGPAGAGGIEGTGGTGAAGEARADSRAAGEAGGLPGGDTGEAPQARQSGEPGSAASGEPGSAASGAAQ